MRSAPFLPTAGCPPTRPRSPASTSRHLCPTSYHAPNPRRRSTGTERWGPTFGGWRTRARYPTAPCGGGTAGGIDRQPEEASNTAILSTGLHRARRHHRLANLSLGLRDDRSEETTNRATLRPRKRQADLGTILCLGLQRAEQDLKDVAT